MPASIEPSITVSAPAAIAFATSPDEVMPPSAITGIPCLIAASATSKTAVTCGTPTPATTRVVQIDPGPTPAFRQSAPASISASAASPVAMLPAISSMSNSDLIRRTISTTAREWPWAVSTTITSTSAATRAAARSSASRPDADGGPDPQSSPLVLGRERVALALLDVLDRDQAAQAPGLVDDGKLLDLVAPEQELCFGQRRADRCRDQVLARHQLARPLLGPGAEAEIAVREDPDEHAVGARDRDARDAVAGHQVERVGDEVVGAERDRLDDHPRLAALHLVDLGHLMLDRRDCGG